MSGLGVAIANRSDTMQQTMFVMFFFVMIFVLMSGLITPIASMPGWAQAITRLLPPRYFIGIMRAVYLKGTALGELWGDYAALAGFALVFGMSAILLAGNGRRTAERLETGISVGKNEFVRQDACIRKIIRIFTKMLR